MFFFVCLVGFFLGGGVFFKKALATKKAGLFVPASPPHTPH